MKNLKIWQKLALMVAVLSIPFAVVTYKMVSSIDELSIEFARLEMRGVEYIRPLLSLLRNLELHRDLAYARASGEASFADAIAAARRDLDNDLLAVGAVDQRHDAALDSTTKWKALEAACRQLLEQTDALPAEQVFARHSKVIQQAIALVTAVGDTSKLTLDPDLDSYYLMNIFVFQGPVLSEWLSQVRGLGGGIAAAGSATPAQLVELERITTLAEASWQGVDESLQKAFTYNAKLAAPLDAHRTQLATAARSAIAAARQPEGIAVAGARPYSAATTPAVEEVFALEGQVATSLMELLVRRAEKFQGEIRTTLAWAALGLLLVSIIGVFIIRDITRSLGEVVTVANRIATGDLAVPAATVPRQDEIGVLRGAFDRMVAGLQEMVHVAEKLAGGDLAVDVRPQSDRDAMGNAFAVMVNKLSTLVGHVRSAGMQVSTSVTEIAATARQEQATASEIAATTIQVSTTSKEIAATSLELVRTMNEVATVAEQSAVLASTGQGGLNHMEETMRQVIAAAGAISAKLAVLSERAGNISEVVTTITKVADQTNLLSLNAAIEAEKAGEYGRGFSVVATEIRRLADQTAVATHDIEQTVKEIQSAVAASVMGMDKFSEEVRRGMQAVQEVGGQLSQIIHQVQTLAPRFEAVNEGMQAQATGAGQITEALAQLSEAAQQTVESLRQSGMAIGELNEVAGRLHEAVARFRLHE